MLALTTLATLQKPEAVLKRWAFLVSGLVHEAIFSWVVINPGCKVSQIFFFGFKTCSGTPSIYMQ